MTLTFSNFGFSSLTALLRPQPRTHALPRLEPQLLSAPEADEAHADRAFVRELLAHNPEAVQSEQGMMMLMALYPKHF